MRLASEQSGMNINSPGAKITGVITQSKILQSIQGVAVTRID